MAGKRSVQAYANLVALFVAFVAFAILVVSYVFFGQKSYIRSDYLVVFIILNIVIAVFFGVYLYYKTDNEIKPEF